jgi:hypothetical protein
MTEYRTSTTTYSLVTIAARAAKTRRQAVLRRVRAQRAAACKKRSVAHLMQEGLLLKGSQLRDKYAAARPAPERRT